MYMDIQTFVILIKKM